MVKITKIARGKKWTDVRQKAVFENMVQDVKWIDATPAIQDDIKAYQDSLTPTKSEKKK